MGLTGKYQPYGKKRRYLHQRADLVHCWLGPRSKHLRGTGVAIARLAWDRWRNK